MDTLPDVSLVFCFHSPSHFPHSWWPGDGRHGCWDRLSKTPQFKLMPELQNRTRKPRNVCHFYQNNNLKTLAYTSLNELEWFWMTGEYYTSIIPRVKRGRHRSCWQSPTVWLNSLWTEQQKAHSSCTDCSAFKQFKQHLKGETGLGWTYLSPPSFNDLELFALI